MGHNIEGLIVPPTCVAEVTRVAEASVMPLQIAGLAFVPMTDALHDRLVALLAVPGVARYAEFWKLAPSGVRWLENLSAAGAVAYVETSYSGGFGEQAAAVWEAGRLVLGPQRGRLGPINDALRRLGVVRTGSLDEFQVAGLHRHRSNDRWLGE